MTAVKFWDGTAWQTISAVQGPAGPAGATGYETAPIGTVLSWTGQTAPAGFVVADGFRYTQAAYSQGYAFAKQEADAGNTLWTYRTSDFTFTVPDLRSRFILGAGARALGVMSQTNPALANAGEETHTLLSAEMPVHSHPATAPGAFVLSVLGQISHNSVNNSPA